MGGSPHTPEDCWASKVQFLLRAGGNPESLFGTWGKCEGTGKRELGERYEGAIAPPARAPSPRSYKRITETR